MSGLRELYQSVILDHNKKPRNFGPLEGATHTAEGFNPLCGDQIHLALRIADGVIEDVRFEGSGCAISVASASIMTQAVKGRPLEETLRLFEAFHGLVTSEPGSEADPGALGKLAVFGGVREFPVRVKCATLAWHTLRNAIEGRREAARTE